MCGLSQAAQQSWDSLTGFVALFITPLMCHKKGLQSSPKRTRTQWAWVRDKGKAGSSASKIHFTLSNLTSGNPGHQGWSSDWSQKVKFTSLTRFSKLVGSGEVLTVANTASSHFLLT